MASSVILLVPWLIVSTTFQQVLTAQRQGYHTISVESLLSSTMCSSAPAVPVTTQAASRPEGGGSTTFPVHHRACRPFAGNNYVTVSDHYNTILRRDRHRVRSIHRRLTAASDPSPMSIPARLGLPFHSHEYVVTIGIGTPRRNLTVLFDTGSDLSWVQCTTCRNSNSCYHQEEPLFDPTKSSSYSNVPCSTSQCEDPGHPKICRADSCRYNVTYVDGSSSWGNLAYEAVALSPAAPAHTGIVFGCGDVFQDFDDMGVSGLLGLGQGPMSMVWQTQHHYGGSFAYCLPPRGGSAGYLTFGDALQLKRNLTATFTPILSLDSFYVVHIDDVSVDGVGLPPIPGYAFVDGAIIDSGTVVTQLLPAAYYPMRDEFRRHMAGYTMLPEGSAGDGLDTCYNVTGLDVVKVPRVALQFGGGVVVDVHPSGILLVAGASGFSVACLAFQPMTVRPVGVMAIIGNMQQRTYNVVFDLGAGMVGFGANGCS